MPLPPTIPEFGLTRFLDGDADGPRRRSSSDADSVIFSDRTGATSPRTLLDDLESDSEHSTQRSASPSVEAMVQPIPHDLPIVTKEYEDQFLREALPGERPCAAGEQCEGLSVSGSPGFILREFLLPDDLDRFERLGVLPRSQQLCLLCCRKDLQRNLMALKSMARSRSYSHSHSHDGPGGSAGSVGSSAGSTVSSGSGSSSASSSRTPLFTIQPFANLIDMPNEYKHGICHPVQPEYGIVAPIVRHKRKLLRFVRDGAGVRWYKQIRVEYEDPDQRRRAHLQRQQQQMQHQQHQQHQQQHQQHHHHSQQQQQPHQPHIPALSQMHAPHQVHPHHALPVPHHYHLHHPTAGMMVPLGSAVHGLVGSQMSLPIPMTDMPVLQQRLMMQQLSHMVQPGVPGAPSRFGPGGHALMPAPYPVMGAYHLSIPQQFVHS